MEPATPLPIEKIIAELANGNDCLLNSRLAELSNLSSGELETFKHSWAAVEPDRRRQIVYRLAKLAEDNMELNFDSIFKHCLRDQDEEVRSTAIEELWENEEAALIAPLINLLERDSSEKVQAAAAAALGKFVMLAEHGKLRSCHVLTVQEALLAVLDDKHRSEEVRRRALEAAAPLSLPRMRTAILEAYQGRNPRLKISAIYAMGKNCDPSWLQILLSELTSNDAEVRYEAAGACGELEEEEAASYLIKLDNDADIDVRIAAIKALGKVGGAEAKEYLEQCLENSSDAISQAAEQALLALQASEVELSF